MPEHDYGKGGGPLPVRVWDYPYPALVAVVRLGGRRAQVVVERWHGASTAVVSIYGVLDGRLALLPFREAAGEPAEVLHLDGSAPSSATATCVRGGALTTLRVWWTGKPELLGFTRTTYRLERDGFRLAGRHTTRGSLDAIAARATRAGYGRPHFAGCLVARPRR